MFFNDDNELNALHTEVMIEQPDKIKRYREIFEESKNDTLDAFHIAYYFRIERFSPSTLKEEKYLALQHLTRTRLQLIELLVRTKKHFTENIYYKCNTLPSELKNDDDISTKLYCATLNTLMTENYTLDDLTDTPLEEFSELLQKFGRVRFKASDKLAKLIQKAIRGFYYKRLGFQCSKKYNLSLPDKNFYTGIMVLQLKSDILSNKQGCIHFSSSLEDINEDALEKFDCNFNKLEKNITPSQLKFEKAVNEIDKREY